MKHLKNSDLYYASFTLFLTSAGQIIWLFRNDDNLLLQIMAFIAVIFNFCMALKFFINARRTKYIEFYGSKEELVSQIKDTLDIK